MREHNLESRSIIYHSRHSNYYKNTPIEAAQKKHPIPLIEFQTVGFDLNYLCRSRGDWN